MTDEPCLPADDLPEQMRVRLGKREELLSGGVDPCPVEVPRTHSLREIRETYADLGVDVATGERAGVVGRVMFIRNTGKLCFATLQEGDGTQLQAMLSLAVAGGRAARGMESRR